MLVGRLYGAILIIQHRRVSLLPCKMPHRDNLPQLEIVRGCQDTFHYKADHWWRRHLASYCILSTVLGLLCLQPASGFLRSGSFGIILIAWLFLQLIFCLNSWVAWASLPEDAHKRQRFSARANEDLALQYTSQDNSAIGAHSNCHKALGRDVRNQFRASQVSITAVALHVSKAVKFCNDETLQSG